MTRDQHDAQSDLSKRLWNPDFETQASATGAPAPGTATVLEQYKVFLASAQHVSDMRMRCNAFFLTLNTGVLGGVAYLWTSTTTTALAPKAALAAGLIGAVVSLCWKALLTQYRTINAVKYQIIAVQEERLPSRSFGQAEWLELQRDAPGRKPYKALSEIEERLPALLIAIYVLLTLLSLWTLVGGSAPDAPPSAAAAAATGGAQDGAPSGAPDDEPGDGLPK